MKKVTLIVAFMVATVAVNAQVYVGGSFGINTSKDAHLEGEDVNAATSFSLMPEIGYNLDDTWTVGIGIGYSYYKDTNDDKTNGFVINPYARWHFVKWNRVSLFLQGGLAYEWAKTSPDDKDDDDYSVGTFSIGFKPGIKVDLTEKLSFVATVGNLGWETSKPGGELFEDMKGSSTFDFGVDLSQINFAMYFNF